MNPDTISLINTRSTLQGAMGFLAAMAGGIEEAVGDTAQSITYLAGEKLGRQFSKNAKKTQDIHEALAELRHVLREANCLWQFEIFTGIDDAPSGPASLSPESGTDHVELVFRDCMIRQSLFLYGHQQKGSLCNMMFGFFSGALNSIMDRESRLEIRHAGENACLKRLSIRRA